MAVVQMSEASIIAIIVPVISGIMTIIGAVISNHYSNRTRTDEFKTHINEQFATTDHEIAMLKKDIEALDKKTEKHNGVIDRVSKAEKDIAVIAERVDNIEDNLRR